MRSPRFLKSGGSGDENLVPLVNVVFLLMLFFVIAGRIAPTPEGAVELAESGREPTATVVDADLQIDADGNLVDVAGEPVVVADLGLSEETDAGALTIRVDRRAPAIAVATILSTLQQHGARTIELAVEAR